MRMLACSDLELAATLTVPCSLQKLVPCLVRMLGRTNLELLILVVTFLRKLSVFAESKDQMATCEVCAGDLPALQFVLVLSVLHGSAPHAASPECQRWQPAMPAGRCQEGLPLLLSSQTLCTCPLTLLPVDHSIWTRVLPSTCPRIN